MKPSDHSFQNPLPDRFYLQSTVEVARALLGKALVVRHARQEVLAVLIIEVEAYLYDDPASHSYSGVTARNRAMFERGGTCYIYLSYGMHHCMNVVTGRKGVGEAVLVRAAYPLTDCKAFRKRRRVKAAQSLMNGPGKLTQAMGIDLSFNGSRLNGEKIGIVDVGRAVQSREIQVTRRIGISKACDRPLRFVLRHPMHLSEK